MRRINLKPATVPLIVASFAFLIVVGLQPQKVAAAPAPATDAGKCLNNGGEYNAVIFVRVLNSNGTLNHYAKDFTFTVRSYAKAGADTTGFYKYKHNSIISWNGGIAQAFGRDTLPLAVKTDAGGNPLYGKGNLCDPDNNAGGKVPAYAFRSGDNTNHYFFSAQSKNKSGNWVGATGPKLVGYPGHPDSTNATKYGNGYNNGSLSLSCLSSVATSYQFQMTSLNGEGPGSWVKGYAAGNDYWYPSGVTVNMEPNAGDVINDTEGRIYFQYKLAPPPPATVKPVAGVTPGDYVESGGTYQAKGELVNTAGGPGRATASWRTWLDNGDEVYGPGDSLKGSSGPSTVDIPVGGTTTIGALANGVADAIHTKVCSEVYNTAGVGTTTVTPASHKVCIKIANRPYFRVYNGDANVYAAIDDCAATPQGTIRAFNKGGGGQYAGSGAQVAAIAAGAINGFISAAVNPGSLTTPTLLTFANTNGDPYGGTFGDQVTCVSDYWSGVTASSPTSYTEGGINMSAGQDKVVYVNGDAYITGSVTFATSGFTADTVPSYWLIATGNIYISNTVSQLDGVYAAKGAIYTCAAGASVPSDTNWIAANCGAQLRINGAFIANQVKLLRTHGSLGSAAPNEGSGGTDAAEVFTFTPEVWLRTPNGPGGPGASQYDAYTSLPPVL